jgi:hypothetical protein
MNDHTATTSGALFFADEYGTYTEVANVGLGLNSIYYSASKDYLLLLTLDSVLYKFKLALDGKMTPDKKVKLSIRGNGSDMNVIWAGAGLLIAANMENVLRVWNVETDESYSLSLAGSSHQLESSASATAGGGGGGNKEIIKCIAFDYSRRLLIGGTDAGRVLFWKFIGNTAATADKQMSSTNSVNSSSSGITSSELDWKLLPPVKCHSNSIYGLDWGSGEGIVSVNHGANVSILIETQLVSKSRDSVNVVQCDTQTVIVQTQDGRQRRIDSQLRIKGIDVDQNNLLLWNGKSVEIRDVKSSANDIVAQFPCKAKCCVLYKDTVFAGASGRIEVYDMQGRVLRSILISENEGDVVCMHANSSGHLAVR